MTCIAAVVNEGIVYMGGDAAGSNSEFIDVRVEPKVFPVGEFLMGYTTSFRMGQLLKHCFNPPKLGKKEDVMAYMVTKFVPSLQKLFTDGKWAGKKDGTDNGGTFLVGIRGRLFTIEADYQVSESLSGYAACGSGYAYAVGALGVYNTSVAPDIRIREALTIAQRHNPFVRSPFTILSK